MVGCRSAAAAGAVRSMIGSCCAVLLTGARSWERMPGYSAQGDASQHLPGWMASVRQRHHSGVVVFTCVVRQYMPALAASTYMLHIM